MVSGSKVPYVWTEADNKVVASGGNAGLPQGPFVTPYGIPADLIRRTYAAGDHLEVDLSLSWQGQCGRATRFHEPDQWLVDIAASTKTPGFPRRQDVEDCAVVDAAGRHTYEWIPTPPEVIAGAKTLGEVCDRLRDLDPIQFPAALYPKNPVVPNNISHPARVLFDYWKNTEFRYAVVKDGFDWGVYSTAPGELPATVARLGLPYVLRKVTVTPAVAAPPANSGTSTGILADLAATHRPDSVRPAVDAYIRELKDAAATVDMLMSVTEASMRALGESLALLRAADAVCEASMTNPDVRSGKRACHARNVAADIRDAAFAAQRCHSQLRVHTGTRAEVEADEKQSRRSFTGDAGRDLEIVRHRLEQLLHQDGEIAESLKTWWASASELTYEPEPDLGVDRGALVTGAPANDTERRHALAHAVTVATIAWARSGNVLRHPALPPMDHGEPWPAESLRASPDWLLDLVDEASETPARLGETIRGSSPVAVSLSILGKGAKAYASGRAIYVSLLQAHAAWGWTALAENAKAAAGVSGALDKSLATSFANKLLDRLPEKVDAVELRKKATAAFQSTDEHALTDFANEFGSKTKGDNKTLKYIFSILNLVGSLAAAADSSKQSSDGVTVLKWTDASLSMSKIVIGGAELLVASGAEFANGAKALKLAGKAIDCLSGIASTAVGVVAYFEAVEKRDLTATLAAFAAVGGGLASVGAAVAALAGIEAPLVAAIGGAFLLVSGAITLRDIVSALQMNGTRRTLTRLIGTVRGAGVNGTPAQQLWNELEDSSPDLRPTMDRIVESLKSTSVILRVAEREYIEAGAQRSNVHLLRAAGLPDPMIDDVCSWLTVLHDRATDLSPVGLDDGN